MSLAAVSAVSSTSFMGYQPNYQSGSDSKMNEPVPPETKNILSPEQKNTLHDSADAKFTEQAENIKSNYQSAKDLDLTRAYYQQQQKLIDIYMQTSASNDTDINNNDVNNSSTVNTLTDTYVSLYALHNKIKDGDQQLPSIPDELVPPTNKPEISAVNNSMTSTEKQTDAYNSLMMPSSASYLHLTA